MSRSAESVFVEAGSFLKGALAIAREGADDTDARTEDQGRFGAIVDLLEKYQEMIEEGINGKAA